MSGRQRILRSILSSHPRHHEPLRPCLSELRAYQSAVVDSQIRFQTGHGARQGPVVYGLPQTDRPLPRPRGDRPHHHPRRGRPDNNPREEIDEELGYDRRYTTEASFEKSGRDRLPRDHEIKDPKIMVLENGEVEGPLAPRYVLSKMNLDEESLRMIQPYFPADKAEGVKARLPVCQIVNKKDEFLREREAKLAEKKKAVEKVRTKDVEMTWGISSNDLRTKLKQVAGFLQKGFRVTIVLAKKKKGNAVAQADSEAVLRQVKEELEALDARQVKPESGVVGENVRLTVEKKVRD